MRDPVDDRLEVLAFDAAADRGDEQVEAAERRCSIVETCCPTSEWRGPRKMSENESPTPGNSVAETSFTDNGNAPSRWIVNVVPTSGTYVASRK